MKVDGSTGLWLPPFITGVVGDSELQEEPQQLFQGGDTDGRVEPVLHWEAAKHTTSCLAGRCISHLFTVSSITVIHINVLDISISKIIYLIRAPSKTWK